MDSRGLHVDLHQTHTAFAGGRGRHYRVATIATPLRLKRAIQEADKAVWEGRPAERGGLPGGVVGRVE